MKFTFLKTVMLFFVMVFLFHSSLKAQSIGFDFGIAGTQNYGEPNAAFGVSIIMPFGGNFEGVLSYHQWRGEDDNYTLAKEHNKAGNNFWYGTFFGNKGLNLLVNYRYYNGGRLSLLCGAGLSQFEMLDMQNTISAQTTFYGAVTIIPLYVKYQVTDRLSIYTRGSLSGMINEFIPDWGLLNIGIEERIF
ncbi:MAG: hypothetical protein ACM3QX_01245 [Syntrophomonadaceae bacterium]